jgi:uncharacterized membrane protein YhaH (DUF805 family)
MVDGSTQCYYLDASRTQQGPASVSDLARLVRSGAITRDTMIWFAGMPEWRPAGQVNELASLFGPSGPPSASAPPPMRPPMPAASMGAPAMRPAPGDTFGGYAPGSGGFTPPPPRSFIGAIKTCFSKYVGFSGRASRSEYWWFFLFQIIVLAVAAGLDSAIFGTLGLFYFGVALVFFLPSLAAAVRRMHDGDRSGWFLLLYLIPFVGFIIVIVLLCLPGTDGPNRFDVAGA